MENKALTQEGVILIELEGQPCSMGPRAIKMNVTGIQVKIAANRPVHDVSSAEVDCGLVEVRTKSDSQVLDLALAQSRFGVHVSHWSPLRR